MERILILIVALCFPLSCLAGSLQDALYWGALSPLTLGVMPAVKLTGVYRRCAKIQYDDECVDSDGCVWTGKKCRAAGLLGLKKLLSDRNEKCGAWFTEREECISESQKLCSWNYRKGICYASRLRTYRYSQKSLKPSVAALAKAAKEAALAEASKAAKEAALAEASKAAKEAAKEAALAEASKAAKEAAKEAALAEASKAAKADALAKASKAAKADALAKAFKASKASKASKAAKAAKAAALAKASKAAKAAALANAAKEAAKEAADKAAKQAALAKASKAAKAAALAKAAEEAAEKAAEEAALAKVEPFAESIAQEDAEAADPVLVAIRRKIYTFLNTNKKWTRDQKFKEIEIVLAKLKEKYLVQLPSLKGVAPRNHQKAVEELNKMLQELN